MISSIHNSNLDAAELFTECLSQATLVVKQVMPAHYTNATPDSELDVRDVANHMLGILTLVTQVIDGRQSAIDEDEMDATALDQVTIDLSVQWQDAADAAEAAVSEVDLEDLVDYEGEKVVIENILVQLAGDLLIHAWDLGEAIGMPVKFAPDVAEAIMETTQIPNKLALPNHNLFTEPISPPANADLQARLLALFGRSHAWRTAN